MRQINTMPEIKIGDRLMLLDEQEGDVICKNHQEIVAKMHDGEGYIRKIKPTEIISLARGINFFKVSIRSILV